MKISKVYDANVYINDASVHGEASEVTAPTISATMTDYNALGMIAKAEFFNGFEAMETSIKWKYPDNAIKKACANFMKPVEIMIRSSKAEYDNNGLTAEKPVVLHIKGYPKQHETGGYKAKEDVELNTTFSTLYLKEIVDGEEIVEIDVLNNIYKVGGEDLLAERRQNLGI